MTENSRVEDLLRYDKWIVSASLVVLTLLAWGYLLEGAGMSMNMQDMDMNMNMTMDRWSLGYWLIVFMMWWIMMIAMMVPSATPVILLYVRVVRHAQKNIKISHISTLAMLIVSGYLVCWTGFSAIATVLHWLLEQVDWITMKMVFNQDWLVGSVLIVVGIYQLTPLKSACLEKCRSPAEFIASHMKKGSLGALQMGLEHGVFCVGCCWLLMLLLFVGGVMNLLWIAFLAFIVLAEKILPRGKSISIITGYLLIPCGIYILFTSLI